LLSARVQLSEIPRALKDRFLNQLEAQAQQQDGRRPGEDEAHYKSRIGAQRVALEAMKVLARDGESIRLELDLDRKAAELALDLSLTARPGSELAKSLRSLQGRRSRFQEMAKDPSLAYWGSFPLAKELRDLYAQVFDPLLKGDVPGFSTPEKRKLFTRFMELVKTNLSAEELDYGIAFGRQPKAGGRAPHFSLVFGMKVRDGCAFETLIRDVFAEVKPENDFKMEFNVARAADGTAIHRLSGPHNEKDPKDVNMAKVFGKDSSLSFAFREDAIFAAFGEDSQAAVRSAIAGFTASRPAGAGSSAPIAVVARLADVGEVVGEEGDRAKFRRASASAFRGEAAEQDRVSLVLKGAGDGIRLRLSFDLAALKFFATLGRPMPK
jgi:hypothetical protein